MSDSGSCNGSGQKILAAWHHEGIVEWWGQRQEMADICQTASLICLPSHGGEGVPKVLLEAAACGRAIVTSDVPGCRDIVRDKVNGLLVSAKSASELARAIRYLLESGDVRNRMGSAGREIALNEFAQGIVVGKTMALYNDLVRDELAQSAEVSCAS